MLSLKSFSRSSPLTPCAPATAASAILRSPRSLMIGAVGADRWSVEVFGKASHAGVHPERGISATLIIESGNPAPEGNEVLDDAKRTELETLIEYTGESAKDITWTQDCAALVRQRPPGQRDTWLERATASGLQACKSLATGLRADDEAVKAGVTLSWSPGPVEGQSNRLHMRTRQRYGRAHMALLRQRVLLPTEARRVGDAKPAPAPNL